MIFQVSECHAYTIRNIFQTVSTAYVNDLATGLTFHRTLDFKYLFVSAKCGSKFDFSPNI